MTKDKVDHDKLTPEQRERLGSEAGMSFFQSMMSGNHKPGGRPLMEAIEEHGKKNDLPST